MQITHAQFHASSGWSHALPRELDGPSTLVLAFGAPEFGTDAAPLRELAAAFPGSIVAGCSTAGEIAGQGVHDASISVAIVRFEHTTLGQAIVADVTAAGSAQAGERLAKALAGPGLQAVFVLSDGVTVNGTSLVGAMMCHLPPGVAVSGGLAGDGSRFGQTWVLAGGEPRARHVSAIGLYGERLRIGHGCDGGWSDFGPERRITRSQGNVLYELDGEPALALYRTYLGERAEGLPGTALLFPLSLRRDDGEAVVRTILGIDEASQSLTFAGDMPQGAVARLMRANTDKLIGSAGAAARQAALAVPADRPALAISVSCVGRRLVLGERTDEEVETVVDEVPRGATHVGFYSYGEISPAAQGGVSDLHNQTMTVTVLSEV